MELAILWVCYIPLVVASIELMVERGFQPLAATLFLCGLLVVCLCWLIGMTFTRPQNA